MGQLVPLDEVEKWQVEVDEWSVVFGHLLQRHRHMGTWLTTHTRSWGPSCILDSKLQTLWWNTADKVTFGAAVGCSPLAVLARIQMNAAELSRLLSYSIIQKESKNIYLVRNW